MGYYVKSVVPVIESNYDKFTTVEKTIADFFIQNKEKSDFSVKCCFRTAFCIKGFAGEVRPEMWLSWL